MTNLVHRQVRSRVWNRVLHVVEDQVSGCASRTVEVQVWNPVWWAVRSQVWLVSFVVRTRALDRAEEHDD